MKEEKWIDGHRCFIYGDEADIIIIQMIDSYDLEHLDEEVSLIQTSAPYRLIAVLVDRWHDQLSPWKMSALFKGDDFQGHADQTLKWIRDTFKDDFQNHQVILAGYSLAGLFALYGGYQEACFDAIVAASPSVWFIGWDDFIKNHRMQASIVYLSLGRKEEKTRHRMMAQVGERIRLQDELLNDQGITHTLVYNPGNHFQNPQGRVAQGLTYVFAQLMRD